MRIFLWTIAILMFGVSDSFTQDSSNFDFPEDSIEVKHQTLSDSDLKELYGPIINCDPNLEREKLIHCVDDKYSSMRKSGKDKFIEETYLYLPKEKQDIPTEYKEIENFKNIKSDDVYKNDAPNTPHTQYRMDSYNGMEFGIRQNPWYIDFSFYEKDNRIPWRLSSYGGVDKYAQNFNAVSKDILIVKENSKNKIYTASYEVTPLKNGKVLYIIAIGNFCQISSDTKIFEDNFYVNQDQTIILKGCIKRRGGTMCGHSKNDLTKLFDQCGTNYIYYVDDFDKTIEYSHQKDNPNLKYAYYVNFNEYPNKIIHLSADRRINPTELYIKLGNNIFSLTLYNNGGLNR